MTSVHTLHDVFSPTFLLQIFNAFLHGGEIDIDESFVTFLKVLTSQELSFTSLNLTLSFFIRTSKF